MLLYIYIFCLPYINTWENRQYCIKNRLTKATNKLILSKLSLKNLWDSYKYQRFMWLHTYKRYYKIIYTRVIFIWGLSVFYANTSSQVLDRGRFGSFTKVSYSANIFRLLVLYVLPYILKHKGRQYYIFGGCKNRKAFKIKNIFR